MKQRACGDVSGDDVTATWLWYPSVLNCRSLRQRLLTLVIEDFEIDFVEVYRRKAGTRDHVGDVGALADDRLRDAADVDVLLHARHRDFHVQRDFIGGVHLRRHIDVDADVGIVKLRGHQCRGGVGRVWFFGGLFQF